MRTTNVQYGPKNQHNKNNRTDLLQILTTLYPQKIVKKRRTRINNKNNKNHLVHLEDLETSSQESYGPKNQHNKDNIMDLLQVLATLYPQKILKKPRTKFNRLKTKSHVFNPKDLETSQTTSQESSDSCEGPNRNNLDESMRCITDFLIPGNIPDIESLMSENELLKDLFLNVPVL
jgi:hypothetical protein